MTSTTQPDDALDNPFWSALRTLHCEEAMQAGAAVRYPADYAPFLGVADAEADVADDLPALVAPGESVYLLGVAPARVPAGWRLEALGLLAQMVCDAPVHVVPGPPIIELDAAVFALNLGLLMTLPRTQAWGEFARMWGGLPPA